MSLRLASFSLVAALIAAAGCTSSISLVGSTSTTGSGGGSGGDSSTSGSIASGTGGNSIGIGGSAISSGSLASGTGGGPSGTGGASSGTGGASSGTGGASSGTGGPCDHPCPTAGATRCTGNAIQTCMQTATCLAWGGSTSCPAGEVCSNDATHCLAQPDICNGSSECGCGCGCAANQCFCTGALPPTCASDAECGPACAGYICVANYCVSAN